MLRVLVNTARFSDAIRALPSLTGKELGTAVKEQARLLAKRLMDLTPPKNASVGKKRVAIDIGRVFLRNEWFENIFQFRNQKLGDRVKEGVRKKDDAALRTIFERSQKLEKIHIERFDASRHQQGRNKAGRVTYKAPYSYPLDQQAEVRRYTEQKKKNVGIAKSGWGACFSLLGGSVAGWLSRPFGAVENHSGDKQSPNITIINRVSYYDIINNKLNVLNRALEGRTRDMIKAAESAIRRARRAANL